MDNDAKLIDSAEIEELQDRIEALESDQAMDAGVLDGYLTAQALNPLKPEDDDVLPFIFSATLVTQRRFLMTTDCLNSLNFVHAKSALR